MKKSTSIYMFIAFLLLASVAFPQRLIQPIDEKYVLTRYYDYTGKEVVAINVPGSPPPKSYKATDDALVSSAVLLNDVPAFSWSFGCSSTSASMIAGYYDRHGYPNMYAGPTNGGVMPLNNSYWGSVAINGDTLAQCPLAATRMGLDGRSKRGHVDDYWIKVGSEENDPFIANGWVQHEYSDCVGDFMKTSQSSYDLADGSTTFYHYTDGTKYYGTETTNGAYGLELFFKSRGYTVLERFTQTIVGFNNNTKGFSFNDYKNEIDAGRPVLIGVVGHSMVGVGYDSNSQKIYVHNTWDYNLHTMTWGGQYYGMQHYRVSVFKLGPSTTNPFNFKARAASSTQINLNWELNSSKNPVLVAYSKDGNFGLPVNGVNYSAGQVLEGGGEIIYSGSATSYNHTVLTPSSTYYYKAWSKTGSNYSDGVTCVENTQCGGVINSFPYKNDFSVKAIPPCWSINDNIGNGQVWSFVNNANRMINTSTGENGFFIIDSDDFGKGNSQNSDLVSPEFDFSNYTSVTLQFEHFFTYYSPSKGTLAYSTNGGATWTNLRSWTAKTANSELFNMDLSAQLAGKTNVKFKWNYTGTYALFWAIDDIVVSATGGIAPSNDNCANATPLSVGTTTNSSLRGATQSISENVCGNLTSEIVRDVWFKFTATSTKHSIAVNPTFGLNAIVELRQGTCNGTRIGCVNAGGNGVQEVLTYNDFIVGNTYFVRVYQDGQNTTTDFEITISTPVQPDDFTIQDQLISLSSVAKGGKVTASCSQCYSGAKLNSQMNSTHMGYYLSSNTTYEAGIDQLLATDESDLGNDNLCQGENAELTIPLATQAGNYYILFIADDNGQFAESDESNNLVWQPITVTAPLLPDDFYPQNQTLSATNVIVGGSVVANSSQCYSGSKSSSQLSNIRLGYYLSVNNTFERGEDVLLTTDDSDLGSDKPCENEDAILTIPSATQVGTYFILFVADDNMVFSESNESNNIASQQLVVLAEPVSDDFYIRDIYFTSTTVEAGGTLIVSCSQCYTGSKLNSQMNDSKMGYYLSTNTIFEPESDILLATDESDLGRDNSCNQEDETITIPQTTTTGIYYILFVADYDQQFVETNEQNNVSFKAVNISSVSNNDDLYISGVSLSDLESIPGSTIKVSCAQCYLGSKSKSQMKSSRVGYFLSTDKTFEVANDKSLGYDDSEVGSDNPCQTEEETLTIPVGTPIGTYYILFVADDNSVISETNEDNNSAYKELRIIADTSREDFFISGEELSPDMLPAGRTIEVGCLQNYAGARLNSQMGSVKVGYYISTNPNFDLGVDLILGSDISDLGSDVPNNYESATLTIPLGTTPGIYYILFVADYDGQFNETEESNNVSFKQITVSNGSVDNDCTIQNPMLFPNAVMAGGLLSARNSQCYSGSKLSYELPDISQGYYLSTNQKLEPAIDVLLGTSISNLGSDNHSESEESILTVPEGLQSGAYYILFVSDYNNQIIEIDETNNVFAVPLTITPNTFIVTALPNPNSGGSTSGTGTYHNGETCLLTAIPNYGYIFSYWSENGDVVSTDREYEFTATSNRTLYAIFVQNHGNYVVETIAQPEGLGTVYGGGAYEYGERCTVKAIPSDCYVFARWLEDGYTVSSEPIYQFNVNSNRKLTAIFEKNNINYNVYTTLYPNVGGRIVSGGGKYTCGKSCTLTVEPNEEYFFLSWTDNDSVLSIDHSYTFEVKDDKLIQANFIKKPVNCDIQSTVSPSNSGYVEGTGLYLQGSTVFLIAMPNPGYIFSNWTEDGNVVSTLKTYSFTATISRNLKANFICKQPDIPVFTEGETIICQSSKNTEYTVNQDPDISSYNWILPNNVIGNSRTNSITIDFGDSFKSGIIKVRAENFCGVSPYASIQVDVAKDPQKTGDIDGKKEVCQGENDIVYTVPEMPNATSYIWSLPQGFSGNSNSNSILINISLDAQSGIISVKGVNDCEESDYSSFPVTVRTVEGLGAISGQTDVCVGELKTYSVSENKNVLSYIWTLPNGVVTSTAQASIDYYISNMSSGGTLKLKGRYNCGDGPESTLEINVNSLPEIPKIDGPESICAGSSGKYSVAYDPQIKSYSWIIPAEAEGSSTSNSIDVKFNGSESGNIRVKGENSCGFSQEKALFVSVYPIPPTPVIDLLNGVLESSSLTGNQWFLNNVPIEGATNQSLSPTMEGDYFVVVSLNSCPSDPSNTFQYTLPTNGLEALQNNFNVYPNPVSTILSIDLPSEGSVNLKIEVVNSLGKIVYSGICSTNDGNIMIDFSRFTPGLYMLRIKMGEQLLTQKLIKK